MALTTTITADSGATGNYVTVAGAPPQTTGITLCMWIAMPFDAMQTVGNSTLDTPEVYLFRASNGGWPRMDFACLGQRGATYPVFRMQVFSAGPDHDTGVQHPTDIIAHATNGSHNALTWMFAAFTWDASTGATTMYCCEVGGSVTTVATETLGTSTEIGSTLNQIDICSLTDNSSFTGPIWNVKTFASVLSVSQIQAEASSAAPTATAWNWLPLETGSGRLTDASGNGHNATAVGTLSDGAEEPSFAPATNSVATVEAPGQPTQSATIFQNVNYIDMRQGPSEPTQVALAIEAAAPTFVAAGTFGDGSTSVTLPHPSGIVAGDILLADLESANQAVTFTSGGTWTQVTNSPQGTGTAGGSSATRLTKFWSRYDGSQSAPQFACSGGNHVTGVITAWRGCVPIGVPIHVSTGGVKATSSTTTSIAGSTTTTNNCTVVVSVSRMDDSNAAHYSAWTNSSLSGVTEVADGGGATGNGGGIGVAYGTLATAGTYGATTATNATTTTNGFMTVALLGVKSGTALSRGTQSAEQPTQTETLTQLTGSAVGGTQSTAEPTQTETLQTPNSVATTQAPTAPTQTETLAGSNAVAGQQAPTAPTQTDELGQSYAVAGQQAPSAPTETEALLQPALVTTAEDPAAPVQTTTLAWQSIASQQEPTQPDQTEIVFQGANVAAQQSPVEPSETGTPSQFAVAGNQAATPPTQTDALTQPSAIAGQQSATQPTQTDALVQANTVVGQQAPTAPNESGTAAQSASVATQQSATAPNETAAVVQGANVATFEQPTQPIQTESVTQPARVTATESPTQPNETTVVLQVSSVAAQQRTIEPAEQETLQQGSLVTGSQAPDEPDDLTTILQTSTVAGSQATTSPNEILAIFATSRVDAQCSPAEPTQTEAIVTYQTGLIFGLQTTVSPVETCHVTPLSVLVGVRILNTKSRSAIKATAYTRTV